MNDFFDLDAPLFRFLTRVADMVILSLLWLIGSLPLFTLGISSTALYYAVNKSLIEDRGTVSEEFFRACRRSFRQATLSFLALAVPESILLADCFMTHYLKGQQAATGNLWIIFTVLSICGLAWMITMQPMRQDSTTRSKRRCCSPVPWHCSILTKVCCFWWCWLRLAC